MIYCSSGEKGKKKEKKMKNYTTCLLGVAAYKESPD